MSRSRFTLAFDHHNMVPGPVGKAAPQVVYKSEDGILLVYGTTVPSGAGYAKGCKFVKVDGAAGEKRWVNEGDATTAAFNTEIHYVTVTLTTAEIKALKTTPKELVAAPGAGKAIEYISCYGFLDYSGAVLTAQSGSIKIGTMTQGSFASSFISASADRVLLSHSGAENDVADTYFINTALTFQLNADVTGASSTSTLTLKVSYRVHDFN